MFTVYSRVCWLWTQSQMFDIKKNPSPNADRIGQKLVICDDIHQKQKQKNVRTHSQNWERKKKKIDRWSIILREREKYFYTCMWSGLWQSFTVKLPYVLNGSFVTMRQISIIYVLAISQAHSHTETLQDLHERWLEKICINTWTSPSKYRTGDKKKEFAETEGVRASERAREKGIAKTKQWKMYQLNSFDWSRIFLLLLLLRLLSILSMKIRFISLLNFNFFFTKVIHWMIGYTRQKWFVYSHRPKRRKKNNKFKNESGKKKLSDSQHSTDEERNERKR